LDIDTWASSSVACLFPAGLTELTEGELIIAFSKKSRALVIALGDCMNGISREL
jgi:hypothetical protein